MDRVEVTFRNLQTSRSLERDIRQRAGKLETYCPRIIACRVLIGKPHRYNMNGSRFNVHIDIVVPGEEIAVSHSPHFRKQSEDGLRKNIRTVVRDAFAAAKRQLRDYVRRRRLEVKAHTARVAVART
jgi:Sigma 54 modulation protein / S30EA ribosomal protein